MRTALIVCLSAVALGAGRRASACDCELPLPPARALLDAAAVCLAEVVKIQCDGEDRLVTLKVDRWWKGTDTAEFVVSTAKNGAACGYPFEKGKRYLIYADPREKGKPLHVSLCSRTRPEKEARENGYFDALGKGKPPATGK